MADSIRLTGDPRLDDTADCDESAPLTGEKQLVSSNKPWPGLTLPHFNGNAAVLGRLKRTVLVLTPSFLTTHTATTPSKSGIAALDGLRGLACLFVFNEHYVICYQSRETQTWIMRVPFIRLLWYGKAAVFLFFVISGYVLSYKPLKLMRSKSYLDFQKAISSSFLRRAMRLYLPCLIVSLFVCGLTYLGLFDESSRIYNDYSTFVFLKEEPPPRLNLYGQLLGYLGNVDFLFSATIPFDRDTDVHNYFMYDDHQWTIPKEFRSSMAVFAVLVTTSRMRSVPRMATIAALACYSLSTYRLYTSLFFAGMLCAEFDLIRQAYYSKSDQLLPGNQDEKQTGSWRHLLHLPDVVPKLFWTVLFTLGVFMISSPQEIQLTPNYLPTLFASWGISDIDNTLLMVGSIFTVWSVATCPSLAPLFNNPFVCYLGKISYALYLVHGTVIKSLGYRVLPWTLRIATWAPSDLTLNLEWWQGVQDHQKVIAHIMGWCFVGTTCFWLSDLFWRFVDIPCVAFARRVEGWVTHPVDNDNAESSRSGITSQTSMARIVDHRRRAASMGHQGDAFRANHFQEHPSSASASQEGSKRKNG
ncbi:uncharacterized protein A1O9_12835 [Exophiala aquamarina CBS 119918]|uniref:Acyltransferase 3 domain-containing protein n=1 Tax=Exophiala aquamarina CBS 119918 TaxID=1182545 RepID=A0A072NUP5_9EURO|nr:uncharacterized protein A1O9_12835 [Exophiala aquamarina CBS 119918]KEF51112.1 hypothetical protein A1O9_12835 [Exophiala aquamarina CBS 119918]